MRNDTAKPLRVILLDGKGKPVVGPGCTWATWKHGQAGFSLVGTSRVLYWTDENRLWKRAEDER